MTAIFPPISPPHSLPLKVEFFKYIKSTLDVENPGPDPST